MRVGTPPGRTPVRAGREGWVDVDGVDGVVCPGRSLPMRMSTPVLVGPAQKAKREERHRSGIEMPHAQCAFLFGEVSSHAHAFSPHTLTSFSLPVRWGRGEANQTEPPQPMLDAVGGGGLEWLTDISVWARPKRRRPVARLAADRWCQGLPPPPPPP